MTDKTNGENKLARDLETLLKPEFGAPANATTPAPAQGGGIKHAPNCNISEKLSDDCSCAPYVKPDQFPRLILNWFARSEKELILLTDTDDETSTEATRGIGFGMADFRVFLEAAAAALRAPSPAQGDGISSKEKEAT